MSSLAAGKAHQPGKSSQTSTETQQEQEPDSIILEEEIDPNYEPTDDEVIEYAKWLGFDLPSDDDLLYIAREGLKAPLPNEWKPCKTTDTEEIYYFNFETGESTWDHPCDEYYKKLYEQAKSKKLAKQQDKYDPKKRKEKHDVKKLLKSSSSGKVSTTTSSDTRDEPSSVRADHSTTDLKQPPKLASPMQRNPNDLRSPNTTPSTSAGDRGGFKPQQSPLDRKPLPGIARSSPNTAALQGGKEPEGGEDEVSFGAEVHDAVNSTSKPPRPSRRSQSRSGRQDRTGSDSEESSSSAENNRQSEEASRLQRKLEKLQEEYNSVVSENKGLQEQLEKTQTDFRAQKQNLIKEHEREVSQMEVDNARELRQLRDSNRESLKNLEEEYEERIRGIEAKYDKKINEAKENTKASVSKETEERVRHEMNQEIESLKRSKESLEAKMKRVEQEKENLEQKVDNSTEGESRVRELQNLKEEAIRAKEQAQQDFIDQKKRLIDDYEKQISDMKQQLEGLTSKNERMETRLRELETSSSRKDEQLNKLNTENEELKKQLQEERSSHEHQIGKLSSHHGNHDGDSEATTLRTKIAEQSSQLQSKDKEINKLRENIAHLEQKQTERDSSHKQFRDDSLSQEVAEFRNKLEQEKQVLQQELDEAYAEHFRKLRALKASESDLKQRPPSSPQSGFLPSHVQAGPRETRSLTSLYHEQQQSPPRQTTSTEARKEINSSIEKLRDCLRQELSEHFATVKETLRKSLEDGSRTSNGGSSVPSELENMIVRLKNTLEKDTQTGFDKISSQLQETADRMARLEESALSGKDQSNDVTDGVSRHSRLESLASSLEDSVRRQQEMLAMPQQDSAVYKLLEEMRNEVRNGSIVQNSEKVLSSIQHVQYRVDEVSNQIGKASTAGVDDSGMRSVLEEYKGLISEHRRIVEGSGKGGSANDTAGETAANETKHAERSSEEGSRFPREPSSEFMGFAVAEALFIGWTSRYQLDESVLSNLDCSLANFKKKLNEQRHQLIQDRELWKADARRILKLRSRSYRVVSSSTSPSSTGTFSSVGAAPSPPKTPAYRYLRPQRSQKSQKPALMDAKKVLDRQADALNRKVHKYREGRTIINEFRQTLYEVYEFLILTKQNAVNGCNKNMIRELVSTLNSVDARVTEKIKSLYEASMERGLPLQWPSTYSRLSNQWEVLQAYRHQQASKGNWTAEDTLSFRLSGSEFSSLSGYLDSNKPRKNTARKQREGLTTDKPRESQPHDNRLPLFSQGNTVAGVNSQALPRPWAHGPPMVSAHPPAAPYDFAAPFTHASAPQRDDMWQRPYESYWGQHNHAYRHWSAAADDHAKWLRQFRESVEKSKAEMHSQREGQATGNQEHVTAEYTPPHTFSQTEVSIDFVSPVTSLPEEVSRSPQTLYTDQPVTSTTSGSPDNSVSTEVSG
eukprot:gb/GECG01004163.1/.p1 GENE.gb/GECG01004163.1/~~gb/GECG01004163.1/.p1  ORF type:complete len:1427 (+),score=279.57 gb/GECG01004163.1/:1-4281(+)